MTFTTTPQWHYISGGKAGEEPFHRCSNGPELDNLANTDEGKRLCQEFQKELEFTAEKPQVAASQSSAPPTSAP